MAKGESASPSGPEKEGGTSLRERSVEAAAAVRDYGKEKLDQLGGAAEKLGGKAIAAAETLKTKGLEVVKGTYESNAVQTPLDHFRAWRSEKLAGFVRSVEDRRDAKVKGAEDRLKTAKEDYSKIEEFFKSKDIAVPAEDQRKSAERIARLEAQIKEEQERLGTAQSAREHFEGKRNEAVDRIAGRIEKKIEANNGKITGLKAEAVKLTTEIDSRNARLETWRKDAGELREVLASLSGSGLRDKDVPEAKAMLQGLEERIRDHEKQVQKLEDERAKIEEKIADAEAENTGYRGRVEEMRTGRSAESEKAPETTAEEKREAAPKEARERTEAEKLAELRERSYRDFEKRFDAAKTPAEQEDIARRWIQSELAHPGGSATRALRALEKLPEDRRDAIRTEMIEKALDSLKSGKEINKDALSGMIESVGDPAKRKEFQGELMEAFKKKAGEKENGEERGGEKRDDARAKVAGKEDGKKPPEVPGGDKGQKESIKKSIKAAGKKLGGALKVAAGLILLALRAFEKGAVALMKRYRGKVPWPFRAFTEWAIQKSESKPEIK